MVKNPPAMQETQVYVPGQEDPLEKEMATHSNILVWQIPWTEESGRLQSKRLQRVRCDLATNQQHLTLSPLTTFFLKCSKLKQYKKVDLECQSIIINW